MKIISLRTGQIRTLDSPAGPWQTATFKHDVLGALPLLPSGLSGDQQADPVNHGGADKAVLVYPATHYPLWQAELSLEGFTHGALGENLVIDDATESTVCLGDQYRIGEALVEVSQPRQPCWKQARRWSIPDLVLRIVETGRTGWYLRVITPGEIESGMMLDLAARPFPGWTIERANQIFHHRKQDREATLALSQVPTLSASWRRSLDKRLNP